jgi:hypothetical protein
MRWCYLGHGNLQQQQHDPPPRRPCSIPLTALFRNPQPISVLFYGGIILRWASSASVLS